MRQGRALVKPVASLVDRLRRTRGITILVYHRVGGRTGVSVDLPAALFAEQMAALAADHRVVTLDEAAQELVDPAAPGEPGVVVTFDDGTADFVDDALPILVDHAVPVTLYAATDHVEAQRRFPDDGVPVSWAGLRDAVATGLVTVGSHTHSHLLLDRVPPADAAADLDRSIDLIGERLGAPPAHFAYPKAILARPDVEAEVRARFRTAAVARTRPNVPGSADLHRLTRSPVQVADGLRWFEAKAAGGLGLENDLRDLVNRWRYRNATS